MDKQRLSYELAESKISEVFEEYRRITALYQRGIWNKDMCCQEMTRGFSEIFVKLLSDLGLKLMLTSTSYPQFSKEFAQYQNGNTAVNPEHVPWLVDIKDPLREADWSEQNTFFHLMESFQVPPEYFSPRPDDMPVPDRIQIHPYSAACVYGTHFNCTDDGGLLTEKNPVGKTFTLRNDVGLKAVLTIREDRRQTDRDGMDFDEMVYTSDHKLIVAKAEFLAEGCIEGYTACSRKDKRDILIRLTDLGSKVYWLAYWQSPDDLQAHMAYPLWQDYFRRTARKEAQTRALLSSLLEKLLL